MSDQTHGEMLFVSENMDSVSEGGRNNMLADVLIPPQLWLFLSHI